MPCPETSGPHQATSSRQPLHTPVLCQYQDSTEASTPRQHPPPPMKVPSSSSSPVAALTTLLLFLQCLANTPPSSMCHHPTSTQYHWLASSHLLALGARASEPQTMQKRSPSHPFLCILASLVFLFIPRSRFRPFSILSSPRISTKIQKQCLGILSPRIQTNTSHHFIYQENTPLWKAFLVFSISGTLSVCLG